MNGPSEPRTDEGRNLDKEGVDKISRWAFGALNALLRHRGLLLFYTGLGLAGGLVFAGLQAPNYEAVVRFVSSPGSSRAVAGVGSDLGPIQQRDPYDYYTTMLASAEVLDAVLGKKPSKDVEPPQVVEPPEVRERRERIRQGLGVTAATGAQDARALLSGANARLDATTRSRAVGIFPVLMIKANWTDPQMAADLANAFLDALSEYDQEIRSSAAKDRKTFIATQITDTTRELKKAEDALRTFRERNRLLTNEALPGDDIPVPPDLILRSEQLQREVTVQSELFLTLKKAFDQARISENDEASSLVVIERAAPPQSRTGVGRRALVGGAGLIGLAIGGLVALLVELRSRSDMDSPEVHEFVGHLATIRRQFAGVRARAADALAAAPDSEPPPAKRDV